MFIYNDNFEKGFLYALNLQIHVFLAITMTKKKEQLPLIQTEPTYALHNCVGIELI